MVAKRRLVSGNFETKKEAALETPKDSTEEEFERKVLAKLGGSIAFVRGGKLIEES